MPPDKGGTRGGAGAAIRWVVIEIDGSFGEGGGQIVRSSLSMAAVLGVPVRITKIRAGRPKPGLGGQHLTAARAVERVCGGSLEGAVKGSTEMLLRPGRVKPGEYSFDVGTAGSTTLVFQTLLPILAAGSDRSIVNVKGGTHNPMAPPVDFIRECFLPAAGKAGVRASLDLVRHGFYPRGGGEVRAVVDPWRGAGEPLDLVGEIEWGKPEVVVLVAGLPPHVGERERKEISKLLGIDPESVRIETLPASMGPGNAVMVRYHGDGRTAIFTSFGEKRKRAELVAREAARQGRTFAESRAPVDPFLADQLILPLALGPGGRFTTPAVTNHARTHAEIIRRFLGIEVSMIDSGKGLSLVSVPGARAIGRPL